jgi:hypothetical protein
MNSNEMLYLGYLYFKLALKAKIVDNPFKLCLNPLSYSRMVTARKIHPISLRLIAEPA